MHQSDRMPSGHRFHQKKHVGMAYSAFPGMAEAGLVTYKLQEIILYVVAMNRQGTFILTVLSVKLFTVSAKTCKMYWCRILAILTKDYFGDTSYIEEIVPNWHNSCFFFLNLIFGLYNESCSFQH